MHAKVGYLAIDTTDPEGVAPFWCTLLDVDATIGDGAFVILSPTQEGLTVGFRRVPEAKAGKNRVHLDLVVDEPGTTWELEGFRWRCMADPEGNEFDLDVLPGES